MEVITLEQVLPLAIQLSVLDKVRLIEKITPQITLDLQARESHPRSLWGLCADLGSAPSIEDIQEIRHEMWGNFPREDI